MLTDPSREKTAVEITKFLTHKHYCENNFLAGEDLLDDPFLWFGAGEDEFLNGSKAELVALFRQFEGKVPRCNITGEEYHTLMASPDVCLCTGRMWISTDPATGVYLQVHQRISTCIRWEEGKPRCCFLHISNPYTEMQEGETGFPTEMAQQSRDYLRQQVEAQKKQIAAATEELASIYHTASCGIMRLLRRPDGSYRLQTFNRTLAAQLGVTKAEVEAMDWSEGFAGAVLREDAAMMREALRRLRQPGESSSLDYRLQTPDGRILYLNCNNYFVSRSDEGDIIQRLTYDVSHRVELETALKNLSFVDTLTGIYNRNRFNVDVEALQRKGMTRLGVVCCDLNGLKEWNDRMGHMAGDALIRRAAACIGAAFPGRAYRIGGDEFAVVWPEVEQADFLAAAAEARARLRGAGVDISIGLCWQESACDVWKQYDEADRRMYREKQVYYQQAGKERRRNR